MSPGADVRARAARAIAAVRFDGRSLRAVLPEALEGLADSRDRALCEAIVFEATRWLPRYEFWLRQLLQKPLPRRARDLHALLLAALAQLDAMALSPHAATSASVEASRLLGQPHLAGLVNAVLRRFVRERDALHETAARDPEAQHAHPAWLIERLRRDWPQQAASILAENNRQAPLWLRANLRQTNAPALQARWQAAGITAALFDHAPAALRIDTGPAPVRLPGWDEGAFSVQDLSAQLAVELLDPHPGERVLDIGAAPGGKTAQILEKTGARLELTALELEPERLQRLRENLERLELHDRARLVQGDGTRPGTWWDGRAFDRILLDAPCSATGIIRRQPDIKWHRRASDLDALVEQQGLLLDAAWPMLREGGRLIYATCSVLRDENDRQIHAFLARTPTARLRPAPAWAGQDTGAGSQRFPGGDGGDGFFYAILDKPAAPDAPAGGVR